MVVFKGRRQWVSLLTIFSAARFGISEYTPEALENQVDWNSLPGAEALHVNGAFNMFAGYITVDEDHGRKNFYWFMEAQENPEDAPVMLWTNGGPGSSGFIGLLTEHGPFSVREGGSLLVDNDYSWNKLANMLYIETPSGVGYSYSETVEDYKTGDDQTAVDNYWLVQGWLDRFPQYRRNAFHISSESYGGHYMPQLAEEIVKRNAQVAEDGSAPVINFAGFLVGNPYTDARSNTVAQYHAYWGKQLLPKPVFEEWWVKCVMGGEGYVWSSECDALEEWMDELIGDLNPYALDFPTCVDPESGGGGAGAVSSTIVRSQRLALKDQIRRAFHIEAHGVFAPETSGLRSDDPPYEPCAQDYLRPYFNRQDVQEALHARPGTLWEQSSSKVDYSSLDLLRPMMPYYNRLLEDYGMSILVFSGDDDSVCATEGTQWWIYDLGYDVDPDCFWKTWETEEQVSGYQTRFEGVRLAFVTVHSAGHEVPSYQPARAFELLKRYFDGSWWESSQEEKPVLSA